RRGPVWHYPVWRSHLIPPRHRSIVDHVEGLLRKLLGWRSGAIPPYLCSVRPDWSMTVEPSPQEWIGALRRSHDALRANVEPLDERTLRQGSYCSEWSIAQVLSHLGSGAEIFALFLEAGPSGSEPPAPESFQEIWQAWNERSPQAQATDALAADDAMVKRLESLDDDELAKMELVMFGMDLDVAGLARLRLGEDALHSWDVAGALDPSATVAAESVNLLIDWLGPLVALCGKPGASAATVRVSTTNPDREFTLRTGDPVRLEPGANGGVANGGAANGGAA